jgi:nitrogen fixation protein FixH
MRPERIWPLAVVAVLVATIGVYVFLYRIAAGQGSATVEPDYYRRAVQWDSTMAQERGSESLGWQLTAQAGPMARDGQSALLARFHDRAGRPLDSLVVRVEAIHNLDAGHPREAALAAAGPGAYSARLPLGRPGLWELRLDARRGREHYVASIRRDVEWEAR